MSTRVTPEEYHTLQQVPPANYTFYGRNPSFRCDVQPAHGSAVTFMQTPDHRAIALCAACEREVKQAKAKAAKA